MRQATEIQDSSRFSREEFLARALEVLSEEGEGKLRIDRLVSVLGVTKGSFYWHFKDRADFVHSLARYWAKTSTDIVVSFLATAPEDPAGRLRAIIGLVIRRDLTRWDLAMRSWATHETEVAAIVREVDQTRLKTVRGLFQRIGFEGRELDTRTRLFVTYLIFESALLERESRRRRIERVDRLLEIFTTDVGAATMP